MKDQQVGHYKILEKLGAGGMGEVWLAEDTRLDRKVALKFLPHFASQDENEKARFIQEAKAAARLSHANIAQIYEIDEEDGRLYIVMEYVSGGSLRDALDEAKGKSLPLEKVLTWVQQTAEGLAEAHSQGIIHRDIKPDNLMLTEKGQVKVTDFGLARLETATRLTASGTTLGTVNYMSPELITGKDVDHRSDLFSLGATFYELLSGQQVFTGQDANAIYYAILNAPVDPLVRYRKDLPDNLERIINKLLERDISLRYQSSAEVATDLRRVQSGYTSTSTSSSVRKQTITSFWRSALPVAGWTAAVALATLLLLRSDYKRIDLSSYVIQPVSTENEEEAHGTWSPDGGSIAYLKKYQGRWQLIYRDLGEYQLVQLTDIGTFPNGVSSVSPFWSPNQDENLIYFIAKGDVWSVNPTIREVERVPLDVDGISDATISPDRTVWAVWADDGLVICPENASPRPYMPFPAEIRDQGYALRTLRFSLDGKNIGFAYSTKTSIPDSDSEVQSEPSHEVTTEALEYRGLDFWIFPWPDGSDVQPYQPFRGNELIASQPSFDWIDSRQVVIGGRGHVILRGDIVSSEVDQISFGIGHRVRQTHFAYSPIKQQLLFSLVQHDTDIVKVSLVDGAVSPIVSTAIREYSPSWSITKNKIAYITERSGENEIWIRDMLSQEDSPLVTLADIPEVYGAYKLGSPAILSPDGEKVVYRVSCTDTDLTGFWFSRTSGGGDPQRVFPASTFHGLVAEFDVTWSPDSIELVAQVYPREDVVALARVKIGSAEQYTVIRERSGIGLLQPRWSPTDNWIVCREGNENDDLLFISLNGEPDQIIQSPVPTRHQDYIYTWSQDGQYLYIASTKEGESVLFKLHVESGTIERVHSLPVNVHIGEPDNARVFASLSPDGESFLTTVNIKSSDIYTLEGLSLLQRRR